MIFYDKAKWILLDEVSESADKRYGGPALYFRKEFSITKPIKKATLYCSAMGVFKAYINGNETDNDYLSPGWTDYRKRIPYMTYDIANKLTGENAVGITVGDGWAVGYIGYEGKRQNYSDRPELLASIVIEYLDDTVERIETDNSWRVSYGAIVRSDLLMGEYVDARLDIGNFSIFGYNDKYWHNAVEAQGFHARKHYMLEKAIAPKTVIKHVLDATFLYIDRAGRLVYDLGQNMVGVPKLTVTGTAGTQLTVRYGEMLNSDGTLYNGNLRRAEATDTFVLSGDGIESFQPLFTFHGFRYIDISIEGKVEITELKGLVLYSDLTATADFSCSNDIVNKLYQNIVWGQRGNFLNLPTDCPQRDERLGWTGDSQVFCGTAMFNMDCRDFYKKHLADIRDAQLGNGGVTAIAPVIPHADHSIIQGRVGAAGWADVIAILPYEYYIMYGDISIIKDNISNIKAHVSYILSVSNALICSDMHNYGDWLSIGEISDISLIATAYFAQSVRLAAKLCHIIGDRDASYYDKLYVSIKAAFRARFMDAKTFVLTGDTQTAYLLAQTFGLLSGKEIRRNLLAAIDRRGGRLATGFLGVKYLLPVLCDIGETDLAYKLFVATDYPSWCFSVVNGATTIWERWNSYTIENGFGDETMNSFNHYAYGSVGEWIFKYCLGINPDIEGAGFKKVTIRPYLDTSGKITSAKGHYDSINGRIEITWDRQGEDFIYKIIAPKSMNVTYDFGIFTVIESSDGIFRLRNKHLNINKTDSHN